jgi:hypothetical protein
MNKKSAISLNPSSTESFHEHCRVRFAPTHPESGTWFRAIQPHFLTTALSTAHTSAIPSRFNIGSAASPQFEILYLAENHMVALFEVQALLGSPLSSGGIVPHPRRAWTILNVAVNLQYIVMRISS